jgi:hypothetical protein
MITPLDRLAQSGVVADAENDAAACGVVADVVEVAEVMQGVSRLRRGLRRARGGFQGKRKGANRDPEGSEAMPGEGKSRSLTPVRKRRDRVRDDRGLGGGEGKGSLHKRIS